MNRARAEELERAIWAFEYSLRHRRNAARYLSFVARGSEYPEPYIIQHSMAVRAADMMHAHAVALVWGSSHAEVAD